MFENILHNSNNYNLLGAFLEELRFVPAECLIISTSRSLKTDANRKKNYRADVTSLFFGPTLSKHITEEKTTNK